MSVTAGEERRKDQETSAVKKYHCKQCDYSTKYSYHLKGHVTVVHEGIRRFACDKCEFRTNQKSEAREHEDSVHGSVFKYPCDRCEMKFKGWKNFRGHIKRVHERHLLAKCDHCDYTAISRCRIREHSRAVHEKLLIFGCDVVGCEYRTAVKQLLKEHVWTKHLKRKYGKWHQCPSCDRSVQSEKALQDHIAFAHEKNFKYVCDICSKSTHTQKSLDSHKKVIHEGIREFKCDVVGCGYATVNKCILEKHFQIKHLKTRSDRNRQKCDKCDFKSAYSKKVLQDHVDFKHEKNFKYVCDICDKALQSETILKTHKTGVHKRFELGGRKTRHECDRCNLHYASANTLQDHFDFKHAMIFKYVCDVCKLPLQSQDTLKTHKRIVHDGLKRYKCDKCDYVSSRRLVMRDHIAFKHDMKFKYVCDVCKLPLQSQITLKRHKRVVHDGLKRYKCDQCNFFATNDKTTLEKHISLFHLNALLALECLIDLSMARFKDLITHNKEDSSVDLNSASKDVLEVGQEPHDKIVPSKCLTFKCSQCSSFSTDEISVLEEHKTKTHPEIKEPSSVEHDKIRGRNKKNRFECERCDKKKESSFATQEKLRDHVDFVHNKRFQFVCNADNTLSLKCLICPFVSRTRDRMGRHQENHENVNNNNNDNRDVRGLSKIGMDGRKVAVIVEEEEVTFVIRVKEEVKREGESDVGDMDGGNTPNDL